MWLTRKQFREGVLKRDNYKCVICPRIDDLVAHHILERRLFGETQGYKKSNGATLCPEHHIKAEQTILTCEEIREAAGITEIILPDHFYKENRIDKWGNIILSDGRRLKGELFFDESVQKILKSGGVLKDFCEYIKYPRTHHLPWSGKITNDDRMLGNTKHFEGKEVVASLKMDGENCLDGDSVLITDKGEKTIKEVCNNKLNVKILSYDHKNEETGFKEIETFSILDIGKEDEWYEIETDVGQILRLTSEHRVFLPDLGCYRKVKDLKGDENILLKK